MTSYTLTIRDEAGCEHDVRIEAVSNEAAIASAKASVQAEAEAWCADGEWGDSGAAIDCSWTLYDGDGESLYHDWLTVDIEADHAALIRDVAADPDCDHEWTSEGEGGCDENPGVWGGAGTAISTAHHCRRCGLRMIEHHAGSQRNPGEPATRVHYEQMDREEIERMRRDGHMDAR